MRVAIRLVLLFAIVLLLISAVYAFDSSDNHWNPCTVEEGAFGTARCVYIEYVPPLPIPDSDFEILVTCEKVYVAPRFKHVCTLTPDLIVSTE